jgi:hypothetical protein
MEIVFPHQLLPNTQPAPRRELAPAIFDVEDFQLMPAMTMSLFGCSDRSMYYARNKRESRVFLAAAMRVPLLLITWDASRLLGAKRTFTREAPVRGPHQALLYDHPP